MDGMASTLPRILVAALGLWVARPSRAEGLPPGSGQGLPPSPYYTSPQARPFPPSGPPGAIGPGMMPSAVTPPSSQYTMPPTPQPTEPVIQGPIPPQPAPPIGSADVTPPFAGTPETGSYSPAEGGGLAGAPGTFNMIGDQGPMLRIRQTVPAPPPLPQPFPPPPFPQPPSPGRASALSPAVRGFKIGENQSPQPQDRIFFSFNYFQNLNADINRRFRAPVDNLRVYREIFGLEKTFDQGRGSIGLRLPLNTITADSTIRGNFARPGGTSTSLGDLSIFAKYILKLDPVTGSLITAGIVVTPPTGPGQFAGADYIESVHATSIQPFLGYIWRRGDFYLHGFSALDVPTSVRDVTMVYNDIGMGYFLYRETNPDQFLTAIAPTFETHVNTPLTHRDPFNPRDISGTPDVVNLTFGVNFEFYNRSILTFGYVTPVTGPQPFDHEWLLLFNVFFGRSRRTLPPVLPPVLGG